MKRSLAAVLAAVLAVALTGCAPSLPPYEEVRDETESAMEQIVAALPDGFEVEDQSKDPYSCDDGNGLFYTGHWVARGEDDFDGQAFIDELPGALGDEFVVDDTALDAEFPMVRLRLADQTAVLIDVSTSTADEEPFVDILGLSRCGASPAD